MITCPQCGTKAPDGAKFCDSCGQGLMAEPAPPPALTPLLPKTIVRGYEVVELAGQSSIENRYRASRVADDGAIQSFRLRERRGPQSDVDDLAPAKAADPSTDPVPEEDPNGPRARTAELRLPKAAPETSIGVAIEEVQTSAAAEPVVLTEAIDGAAVDSTNEIESSETASEDAAPIAQESPDDLGELFGRVLFLSSILKHPAFNRALEGFAHDGRVYLVYSDDDPTPLSRRRDGIKMRESDAIDIAIQICQAVAFLNRQQLRLNDICPESVACDGGGRIKLLSLDYVSNDIELQSDPIFNDGYSAPEIYRGRGVDKRADVFSIGALLYTCLTGERIEVESWRETGGAIQFYPPHVVSPEVEQAVRRAVAFTPADRWPSADAFKAELVRINSRVSIRAAALTDVGMVRDHNEDSVMAAEYRRDSLIEPAQNFLYVVADGMGGAAAGEVASAIAVGVMRDYVESRISSSGAGGLGTLLTGALEEANKRILEYQAAHPEARGMGSTGVSALIGPPDAAVAWVGDSRAYLWDDGALRQLTRDHSLVQRLIEIGQITPEQARHHEHKNVITRSLGARQSGPAGAETLALRLKRGDRLLLCSDGLTTHVEDAQIAEILGRHNDPNDAARELIVAANAGGGTDNISVIVVFAD